MVYFFKSTAVDPPATLYMGKDKFENEELIKFGWDCDVWFHVEHMSSAHVYLRLCPYDGLEDESAPTEKTTSSAKPARQDPLAPNTDTSKHIDSSGKDLITPRFPWTAIPPALLTDIAQLTKANSIEGNKVNATGSEISIIYTPLPNLSKTAGMATGQVGFHRTNTTSSKKSGGTTTTNKSSSTPSTPGASQQPDVVNLLHTKVVGGRINAIINRLEKTRTNISPSALSSMKEGYLARVRSVERREAEIFRRQETQQREGRRKEREERDAAWEKLRRGEVEDGQGGGGMKSNEDGFDEDDFM